MKVVFDAERLRNPNSGLGQFCSALGRSMIRHAPAGAAISFVVPRHGTQRFEGVENIPTAWWQRFRAPAAADVWHAPHQDYWIRPPADARVVLSILDLNFLERADYSDSKKARRLAAIQRKVERASAIATISEFTATVVRRHLRVPDVPLRVIHLGNPMDAHGEAAVAQPSPPLDSLTPGSFFVFVGVIHPKKNVKTLLPVLEGFPGMKLVLAGPDDHPHAAEVRAEAQSLGLAGRVILPGPVDEGTKRWLYENARALLFPSLSEGFGLPVVEAMSVGKPAFLSRLTSLPEIGGTAARYFESFEPASMVRTIRDGLAEYDAHPGRAADLRAWAGRFSWERAAREYWALYAEALRSPRR